MGPKKKKPSKGAGKDDNGSGLGDDGGGGSSNPKELAVSRQLDRDRIDNLSNRVKELVTSNDDLRSSSNRNEKDTHDIVLYFQREVEVKDDIISRLNEELVKRETQLKHEVEALKRRFNDDIILMRSELESTVSDLTTKLTAAESDLLAVDQYVREKARWEEKQKNLEESLKEQRQQMFDALEEQETKFLEEKSHMYRELDEQKVAFREIALKEARQHMNMETKRIFKDNARLQEEVKFHQEFINDIETEKASLLSKYNEARRDVVILNDKELEYAKLSHFKSNEIKSLRERVEHLEKQQVITTEKFTQRTKELQVSIKKDLEYANLDAAGLRRLLKLKNQELKNMKSLAATILNQRSEMEQFFLESLSEVKQVIKQEKRLKNITEGNTSNRKNSSMYDPKKLPAVKGSIQLDSRTVPSALPLTSDDSVYMKDLSWDDKELILRVLFAKINNHNKAVKSAINETTANRGSNVNSSSNATGTALNTPFFISEGGGLLPSADIDMSQFANSFEVNLDYSTALDDEFIEQQD